MANSQVFTYHWFLMGDKAAAASQPFGDFGDQQPSHWEAKPPIVSSYLANEGRQGGSGSQEQPRMEIMKGDKWRETRRQRQPRAGQNGNQKGRQMKGDKAAVAAKSSPETRSGRETYEGRQGGSGSQERPRIKIMKEDKAAAQPRAFCLCKRILGN